MNQETLKLESPKFVCLIGMMDQIQNCNYAIELGRQLRFSLVGIQGKDIYDANQTLTLGKTVLYRFGQKLKI